jgi:hypothetical protein
MLLVNVINILVKVINVRVTDSDDTLASDSEVSPSH